MKIYWSSFRFHVCAKSNLLLFKTYSQKNDVPIAEHVLFNVQVLAHKNTHLAKQAGTYVYNMVTTVLTYPAESKLYHPILLWSEQEPKYFHFVEDLLRPYERALQSEACDVEVQALVSIRFT